uniref:Uncharacterized protein n=1 Tax=Chenopodium quinoa TaxID=63459 RepID=A0A803MXY3_CHEQI
MLNICIFYCEFTTEYFRIDEKPTDKRDLARVVVDALDRCCDACNDYTGFMAHFLGTNSSTSRGKAVCSSWATLVCRSYNLSLIEIILSWKTSAKQEERQYLEQLRMQAEDLYGKSQVLDLLPGDCSSPAAEDM